MTQMNMHDAITFLKNGPLINEEFGVVILYVLSVLTFASVLTYCYVSSVSCHRKREVKSLIGCFIFCLSITQAGLMASYLNIRYECNEILTMGEEIISGSRNHEIFLDINAGNFSNRINSISLRVIKGKPDLGQSIADLSHGLNLVSIECSEKKRKRSCLVFLRPVDSSRDVIYQADMFGLIGYVNKEMTISDSQLSQGNLASFERSHALTASPE